MSLKLFHSTSFALSSFFVPEVRHRSVNPVWVVILASLWLASTGNLALWRALAALPELGNTRGVLFAVGLGLVIAASCVVLLSLLTWRWLLKPVVILCLMVAAANTHFMQAYGVVIDPTMMVNVLHTDARETRDLLGWQLWLTLLVIGAAPSVWVWRTPLRRHNVLHALGRNALLCATASLVCVGTVMLVYQDLASVMRNHTQLRYMINPLNTFWALGRVALNPAQRGTGAVLPIGEDAQLAVNAVTPHPALVVLVVGETARSANFGVNGYRRQNTPRLAAEEVLSWRNAWSCGTNTAVSVPCMFSHLGREAFDARTVRHENLLDVLQRAGLAVLWLDNQSGCKGVCERTPQFNTSAAAVPGLCPSGGCLDEVMLHQLDERIAALPAERRAKGVVLVMHQMGSHGPAYHKRTPAAFKKFMPECASNALQDCSRDSVVNAYDNTILYTDHFLGATIAWLKSRATTHATALMYVSDHGESLGENNLYLHGLPWRIAPDVQKHVPWVTWLSPAYLQRLGTTTQCMRQQQDVRISHDNYFHSVLGLLGVQTRLYQRSQDIFASCRPG